MIKLTHKERDTVADYTHRAKAFDITVTSVDRKAVNVMVTYFDGTNTTTTSSMNLTRFVDLVQTLERRRQLAEYLARGGTVKEYDAQAATGVKAPHRKNAARTSTRVKAPPLCTGDIKFDMYLNALPQLVRDLVIPNNLDPRVLYKEYRELKKEGLIAKYCGGAA